MCPILFCVATSIAEGFGYTFFEPWIQNTMLISRKPPWYKLPSLWNDNACYTFFPVKKESVDISMLKQCYAIFFEKCYKHKIPWNPNDVFLRENVIDFSVLPEFMQVNILEMVLSDNKKREEWIALAKCEYDGWPGISKLYKEANRSIQTHKQIVNTNLSTRKFTQSFQDTFLNSQTIHPQNADYSAIEKHFSSLNISGCCLVAKIVE